MILLRIITVIMIVSVLVYLFRVWSTGRECASSTQYLLLHRKGVRTLGILAVCTVGLLEVNVRIDPNAYQVNRILFIFHLSVVFVLVLLFSSIVFRFTGLRYRLWHVRLVYLFYLLAAVALCSGTILLWQLFV